MSRDWTPEELQAASGMMKAAGHMSYEEFCALLAELEAKKLIADFAAIQEDGTHFCPRCGRLTVKDRLHTNAWSRYADVYICDGCGMDEAIRDFTHEPLPLTSWSVVSAVLDHKAE